MEKQYLRDKNKAILETGFYLSATSPAIYWIEVSEDKTSFTAECFEGKEIIFNFEEKAEDLVYIGGPDYMNSNIKFMQSKLEELSQNP